MCPFLFSLTLHNTMLAKEKFRNFKFGNFKMRGIECKNITCH